jgi:hypothetical protein
LDMDASDLNECGGAKQNQRLYLLVYNTAG